MTCPRCDSDSAYKTFEAPEDPNLWEIYRCPRCNFTWRSSEGESITNPKRYNPKFRLSEQQIRDMPPKPPIPPLRTEAKDS